MKCKSKRQHKRLHTPPASGQKPSSNLVPRDVERMADELLAYHQLFDAAFRRSEQREWSVFYSLKTTFCAVSCRTLSARTLKRWCWH